MLAGENGKQERHTHKFSGQEVAQAAGFIQAVQRAEGGLITGPVSMLQVRYGMGYGRACALAEQLEELGFWAVFIGDQGIRCAQVLRR